MLQVQDRQCATCIYRRGSGFNVKDLEAQIADPKMDGFFRAYRACHHATRKVCCRGFWNRHRDHFTLGQLAQRLNLVQFVRVDIKRYLTRPRRASGRARHRSQGS